MLKPEKIKPIDTRTDEQKFVDEVISKFNKECPEHKVPDSTLHTIVAIMAKAAIATVIKPLEK